MAFGRRARASFAARTLSTRVQSIVGVGGAADKPIPLHASEHLRHGRLLDLREAGQITLRVGPTGLEGDQNRQVADPETQRLQASLAQACEAPRGEADQVAGRREDVRVGIGLLHHALPRYIYVRM